MNVMPCPGTEAGKKDTLNNLNCSDYNYIYRFIIGN